MCAKALLLLIAATLSFGASADMVVIVSVQNPVLSLSKDQVADIFLGRTASFPNGAKAMPIEQPEAQQGHIRFHAQVTGKTPLQLQAYWSKIVFAGLSVPPREVEPEALLRLISRAPNAIAYADRSQIDGSVRVVYSF
jgi:ABC-type phosphate transport system substrate-binding protein